MSRSQPKHKVIYKQLEQMFKNDSSSKLKQINIEHNKIHYSMNKKIDSCQISRASSKQSITEKESKQKGRSQKQMKKYHSMNYQRYCSSIEKIYVDMQKNLMSSKHTFLEKMKSDPKNYHQYLKQLQKMSKCLKQMLNLFLQKGNCQDRDNHINLRVLTEASTHQDQNMSQLSIQNQRKRKSSRMNCQKDTSRKPSIYEMVLMKKL